MEDLRHCSPLRAAILAQAEEKKLGEWSDMLDYACLPFRPPCLASLLTQIESARKRVALASRG